MEIIGTEKELGATYQAKRIDDGEIVFGIAVVKVDDKMSYLIQSFETNELVDGAPAMAYYIAVTTDSIISYNDFQVCSLEDCCDGIDENTKQNQKVDLDAAPLLTKIYDEFQIWLLENKNNSEKLSMEELVDRFLQCKFNEEIEKTYDIRQNSEDGNCKCKKKIIDTND